MISIEYVGDTLRRIRPTDASGRTKLQMKCQIGPGKAHPRPRSGPRSYAAAAKRLSGSHPDFLMGPALNPKKGV